MPKKPNEKYLTPKEAAELLRTSEHVLAHRRCESTGPRFLKLGAKVLYELSDIIAWIEQNKFSSTSEVALVRNPHKGERNNG